jgi:cytochrome c-type biogenesis protein CcmH/NrfF
MWFPRKISLLLTLAVALASGQQTTTGDEMYLQVRAVGEHLKCQCGSQCSYTVASCNMLHCSFRDEVNPQIKEGLQAGLSADQVVEKLIAKYGSALRNAPRPEGFGLFGWAMPFVALLIGFIIAPFVVWSWIKKQRAVAATVPQVDDRTLARYQREIDRDLADLE